MAFGRNKHAANTTTTAATHHDPAVGTHGHQGATVGHNNTAIAGHNTKKDKAGKGLSHLINLLNLLLFAVITALAAHVLDGFFDRKPAVLRLMSSPAVIALAFFAVLAGSVGIATSLFGHLHAKSWMNSSRHSSLAASMITLALTWLAASFGIRSIRSNLLKGRGQYGKESTAIAALLIIAMATTLLNVILLGLFKGRDHHATVVNNNNTGYNTHTTGGVLPTHHKTVDNNNNYNNAPAAGYGNNTHQQQQAPIGGHNTMNNNQMNNGPGYNNAAPGNAVATGGTGHGGLVQHGNHTHAAMA